MKVLSVLSKKGGCGKTTLAIHMSVLAQGPRRRVLLVDTDPQKSLTRWFEARAPETPELVSTTPDNLPDVLKAAQADGVDMVVVDSRPSVERDTVLIARLSDFVLIPTRPSILDLQAIGDTVAVMKHAGKPGAVVLNGCPPSRGAGEAGLTREARTVVLQHQIEVAPVSIVSRTALSVALIDGRAVSELEPSGKATVEMAKLWKWIEGNLWPSARR